MTQTWGEGMKSPRLPRSLGALVPGMTQTWGVGKVGLPWNPGMDDPGITLGNLSPPTGISFSRRLQGTGQTIPFINGRTPCQDTADTVIFQVAQG